jgi:hypothetical protein
MLAGRKPGMRLQISLTTIMDYWLAGALQPGFLLRRRAAWFWNRRGKIPLLPSDSSSLLARWIIFGDAVMIAQR